MKLSCLWVQLGLLMDCLLYTVYIYIYMHISLYLYIAIGYGVLSQLHPVYCTVFIQPCHRGEACASGTWWTAVLHRRSGSSGPGAVRGSVLADHLETTLTPQKSHSELENIMIFNR